MSYDFPANPQPGDEFAPPVGGQTYVWQPPRWLVKGIPPAGGGGGASLPEAPVDTKQYGRQDAAWTEVVPNPTWTTLTGKPATFPPTLPIAETDVTNLVSDLALKAPLASPTFTGDPKAPTPLAGDNDTSIATTAFVTAAVTAGVVPATATPLMDGVAAVGIATKYAREDHKHPSDTTKADITYVDNANSSQDAITANKVSKAGDSMTGPLVMPAGGTATTTNINFGTAGTGIYGSSATQINFATSGTLRGTFFSNSFTTTVPIRVSNGTVAAPGYAFTSDSVSGLYMPSAGIVAMTANGVDAMTWNSGANTVTAPGIFSSPYHRVGTVDGSSAGTGVILLKRTSGYGENVGWLDGAGGLRSVITVNPSNNMIFRVGDNTTDDIIFATNGDIVTNGIMTLQPPAATADIKLSAVAAQAAQVSMRRGGLARWIMSMTAAAESSGNLGSNFALTRYDDAGTSLGAIFNITRSTGIMDIPALTSTTQVSTDNSTKVATTAFVKSVSIPIGGATTQVQYNDAGALAGSAPLTFNKTSGILTVGADPVAALDVATKQYVDAKPSGASVSDTAPVAPAQGQFWFESSTGSLFVWYTDADSGQWVQVNGTSG
jgi:hypothetical protein